MSPPKLHATHTRVKTTRMPIPAGAAAPDAVVFSAPRQPVRLSELYGSTTVLLFFPLAFTATCTEELCTVSADLTRYQQLGAEVYGISVDSPYVNRRYAQDYNIGFPILSDFNREAVTAFDVVRPELGGLLAVSQRAAFVIDAAGIVRFAWMDENPAVLPPFDEIRQAIETTSIR